MHTPRIRVPSRTTSLGLAALAPVALLLLTSPSFAQLRPEPTKTKVFTIDSGYLDHSGSTSKVLFTRVITTSGQGHHDERRAVDPVDLRQDQPARGQ